MPLVVTYWRLPEEESRFLDFLEKSGSVLAVKNEHAASPSAFEPRPVREIVAEDPQTLLLLLAEHRDRLAIVPFQKDGATWYGIHAMKSPAIDYLRGKWRAPDRLGQSNLAAYADYPDESRRKMLQHPKEFVAWAKKVMAWVRKDTPYSYKHKNYRITAAVQEALGKGIDLVP